MTTVEKETRGNNFPCLAFEKDTEGCSNKIVVMQTIKKKNFLAWEVVT
jgi:hypothetical protein